MPFPVAAAITAAPAIIGALGSLFGGGKGKKTQYTTGQSPEAQRMQQMLAQYIQGRIGQGATPYTGPLTAPVNPMAMNAMNIMSRMFMGQPYRQPGFGTYGQYMGGGGGGYGQRPQMPMLGGFGTMPTGRGPISPGWPGGTQTPDWSRMQTPPGMGMGQMPFGTIPTGPGLMPSLGGGSPERWPGGTQMPGAVRPMGSFGPGLGAGTTAIPNWMAYQRPY